MRQQKKRLAKWIARLCGKDAAPAARRATRRGLVFEDLEGRTVPSSFSFGFGQGPDGGEPFLRGGGPQGGGFGLGGGAPGGWFGGEHGPGGAAQSSTLGQDAHAVQQAFQTFDAAYLAAVAALRATATTTTPPTAAGIAAFDTAISDAINALDASIGTDLANLTNTGTTLAGTLDGYTATLQTEVKSAAAGLANSTNAAVVAMDQEVFGDVGMALNQATAAVLAETPDGTITASTAQSTNHAVNAYYQAFTLAIANAEQTSLSSGTALSTSAITSAVSMLQTGLTTAVSSLGSSFTSSTYNPSTTIATELTNLTTALEGITAPTAGNTASSRLFLRTVGSTLSQYEMTISRAIATAITNYNNSLL